MKSIDVPTLMEAANYAPLFDVRTPAEYDDGRIPGAINLPLFSNDERATVGTLYKQEGRQPAILEGLEIVGPKMRDIVERVEALAGPPTDPPKGDFHVLAHCWRGGMRSGSVGWLLEMYGWKVGTLDGGYKAYRNWALDLFERPWNLRTIGGRTGSAKTEVLHALAEMGEQVVDLEGLANHRGSAFGALGLGEQPSQQTFENELALVLHRLDPERPIWIEDESRMIGMCCVPHELMLTKRDAPMFVLDVPLERRLDHLVEIYGDADTDGLIESFHGIERRLGHQRLDAATKALEEGDLRTAAVHALDYYDRAYDHGIDKRDPKLVETVVVQDESIGAIAERLVELA